MVYKEGHDAYATGPVLLQVIMSSTQGPHIQETLNCPEKVPLRLPPGKDPQLLLLPGPSVVLLLAQAFGTSGSCPVARLYCSRARNLGNSPGPGEL